MAKLRKADMLLLLLDILVLDDDRVMQFDELVELSVVIIVVLAPSPPRRRLVVRGSTSNILDAPRFFGDETGEIVVQHAIFLLLLLLVYTKLTILYLNRELVVKFSF